MTGGPEWFGQKRYGFGCSPISWQGWLVAFVYVAVVVAAGLLARSSPLAAYSAIATVTILFIFLAAKTTKGGLAWRWGDKK